MDHYTFKVQFEDKEELYPYKPYGSDDDISSLDYCVMENGLKKLEEKIQERANNYKKIKSIVIHKDGEKSDVYNYNLLVDYTYIKPIIDSVKIEDTFRTNHSEKDVAMITDTDNSAFINMKEYLYHEVLEDYDRLMHEFKNYRNLTSLLNKYKSIIDQPREYLSLEDNKELDEIKSNITKELRVYRVYRKLAKYRYVYGKFYDLESSKRINPPKESNDGLIEENEIEDDFIPETEEEYKLMAGGDIDNDIYKSL